MPTWIDDGDTEYWVDRVNNAFFGQAAIIKNQLLAISPYVSEDVLIAVADKKPIFSDAAASQIFIANPDVSKKASFLDYLATKTNPMLPAYIDNIKNAVEGVTTARTSLEANIVDLGMKKYNSGNRLVHYLLTDTSSIDFQEVHDVLQLIGDFSSYLTEIDLYLQQGVTSKAKILLNQIPSMIALSSEELIEFQYFNTLKGILINQIDYDLDIDDVVQNNLVDLQNIAAQSKGVAGIQAKNLINHSMGLSCFPEVILPIPTQALSVPVNFEVETTIDETKIENFDFKMIPNPTENNTVFHYKLPLEKESAIIVVSSLEGMEIARITVNENLGKEFFDTSNLPAGTYVVSLISENKTLKSEKLIILGN